MSARDDARLAAAGDAQAAGDARAVVTGDARAGDARIAAAGDLQAATAGDERAVATDDARAVAAPLARAGDERAVVTGDARADDARLAAAGDAGAAAAGDVAELANTLIDRIGVLDSAVVAFSGGVDSSVVAALAHAALGDKALAVTAVSPSVAQGELDGAKRVAAHIGIAHETVATDELARPGYRANGRDRCYFCKSELYDRLAHLASARGFVALLSGANQDDQGDWRPGLRAAAEHGVVHPLHDVDKATVRQLARHFQLPSAEKPATPCLASRIPYGTSVDPQTLHQIDTAERAVRAMGFEVLRVRHHGILGRLEVSQAELEKAIEQEQEIVARLKQAGYAHAVIDREPFRSGRLNEAAGRPAASP